MVRSTGADRVIDYTKKDFTQGGQHYDLILDTVGNHSLSACRRVLSATGRCVMVGGTNDGHWIGPMAGPLKALVLSPFVSQKFVTLLAKPKKGDLAIIRDLVEAGKVTPVIDRRYRLSEVPDAIRYLEEEHARGKVVITVG